MERQHLVSICYLKWTVLEVSPIVLACKQLKLEVKFRNFSWKKESHEYILSSFCFCKPVICNSGKEQSSCQLDWSEHVFDALLVSCKLWICFAPSSDSVVDAVIDEPLVVVGNAVRNVAELVFLP